MLTPPPQTETELTARAQELGGQTLGDIAQSLGTRCPETLKRHKGWVGQLLEAVLGANAGSKALPDFPHLGIEMKTIPISPTGRPKESTYVCVAPLDGSLAKQWEDSWVCRKLSAVLWVPIVVEPDQPISRRRVLTPYLWRPDTTQSAQLRADWEGLAELIGMGAIWQMDAFKGDVLQLRPKAANKKDLVWAIDEEGEWVQTVPRGFYLRTRFTGAILEQHVQQRLP